MSCPAWSLTPSDPGSLPSPSTANSSKLIRSWGYFNNVIEADHGKLKQLIRPVRGFKTLKTAYATIKGFEVMRALRKNQAAIFNITHDIRGEAPGATHEIAAVA